MDRVAAGIDGVLIEAQTGLEVHAVARAIHASSSFSRGAFVAPPASLYTKSHAEVTLLQELLSSARGGTLFMAESFILILQHIKYIPLFLQYYNAASAGSLSFLLANEKYFTSGCSLGREMSSCCTKVLCALSCRKGCIIIYLREVPLFVGT